MFHHVASNIGAALTTTLCGIRQRHGHFDAVNQHVLVATYRTRTQLAAGAGTSPLSTVAIRTLGLIKRLTRMRFVLLAAADITTTGAGA